MVPATGRDKAARGVCFKDPCKSKCTSPGACRSRRGDIALRFDPRSDNLLDQADEEWGRHQLTSGVLSLKPNPVPPVVMIQSTSPCSLHPFTISRILDSSSGTMRRCLQSYPLAARQSFIVIPETSAEAFADAVSLTVSLKK